jgi:hypothetical protein
VSSAPFTEQTKSTQQLRYKRAIVR